MPWLLRACGGAPDFPDQSEGGPSLINGISTIANASASTGIMSSGLIISACPVALLRVIRFGHRRDPLQPMTDARKQSARNGAPRVNCA
jgi:hypothetical protein